MNSDSASNGKVELNPGNNRVSINPVGQAHNQKQETEQENAKNELKISQDRKETEQCVNLTVFLSVTSTLSIVLIAMSAIIAFNWENLGLRTDRADTGKPGKSVPRSKNSCVNENYFEIEEIQMVG